MILPAILFLKIRDWLFPKPKVPQLTARGEYDPEKDDRKCDWAFYEQYLQRSVPKAIKELYADTDILAANWLPYDKYTDLNPITPLNRENIIETSDFLGFDIIPITSNESGDPVYLKPGPDEENKLYINHHDSEIEVLDDSIEEFRRKIKERLNS